MKPGGRLVYATCSINTQENQDVRARFLAAHAAEFTPAPALPPGLQLPGDEVQLLPHRHGTDGFYIATFTRRGS